jgi:hypothetical protein
MTCTRPNSIIEITNTIVIKTYLCENPRVKIADLQRIYQVLATWNIPHTDVLVTTKKNRIHLRPRGIAEKPSVEKELRECVICILEALLVGYLSFHILWMLKRI